MKHKILTSASLPLTIKTLRRQKKKIVFTNGTFDILHAGHVRYLRQAHSFGNVLVVGVNSDASVRKYKGPGRPINGEKDRLEVLSALSFVDYVILFSEPTPLKLILKIRPEVLAKGSDWGKQSIVGAQEVEGWGGKVRRVRLVQGRSTTNVIQKVLKVYGKQKRRSE